MMNTKLVYVLTCSEEGTYIEQALMSIWSTRYHNPDANIILLTDDKTDRLLTDKRGELLNYVTEKIVVPFEDDSASMMYRSRWIKTSVRNLIAGDFLFIDCDTIICKSLDGVDLFDCQIGAVWESHLLVKDFCDELRSAATNANLKIGVDLDKEKEYFSSGVLYVKDTPQAHHLYSSWHRFWLESNAFNVPIDQPSLAKANRESNHLIRKIPDTYNCILFTQNSFTDKAHILHIASFRNPSFLFTTTVLELVRTEGLTDWVKECILHPCDSFLPFDYVVRHSSFRVKQGWIKSIAHTCKAINQNLPALLGDFPMQSSFRDIVLWLLRHNYCTSGVTIWMLWKHLHVLNNKNLKDNVCRK